MKKIIGLLLILFYISSYAQTVIQMEEYGGVYRIPCKVNGAKMKLIFDTGADNVCLSLSMAEYLFDNDFISSDDIIGSGSSSVADGRIIDHVVINIKDIDIQGIHLTNVKAVVIDGQNAPLLFGQSAIQKLGSIEINGDILIVKNANSSDNDEYIDRLFEEANQAYENKLYFRAVEKYGKLYAMNQLSDYGIYMYASACYYIDEVQKAYALISEINNYSYFEENKIDIYFLLGIINEKLENYREAASYYHLSSEKIQTDDAFIFNNLIFEADCYKILKKYETALDRYADAFSLFAKMHNVDIDYMVRDCKNELKRNNNTYRNDDIDYVIFQTFYCMYMLGHLDRISYLRLVAKIARANNRFAMNYCNDLPLNPYEDF